MRILFWGTAEFAIPSLRALLGEGHDVVGVVTQPDRPAGRGRELRASPVKAFAAAEAIPVLQPERASDPTFVGEIGAFPADLYVVVAYGQILKRAVLDLPASGCINVHASLLPALRGAAPINWAIARGHERTGVTVMRMVERMDAGPILYQVPEPIGEDECATDLAGRLSEIGAEALVEALALLEAGAITEAPQDDASATLAPRITRADTRVPWDSDGVSVARLIRAMDAVPGAWTRLREDEVKLFRPLPVEAADHGAEPGRVLEASSVDAAAGMLVACADGAVRVREVKPAGKRRMTTAEWVRGRGVQAGDLLV